MKVNSTPSNSPFETRAFVGLRHSAPTFCQSESVGDPLPTPGILRMSLLTFAADALLGKSPSPAPEPAAITLAPAATVDASLTN